MKKLVISLCLMLAAIVGCDDGSSVNNKSEPLREVGVDAGLPVSNDFQAEYAQYIWADSPKIFIPTFGTTFDLTSKTYYDVNSVELNGLTNISVEFWFDPVVTGTFDNYGSTVFSTSNTSLCAYGDDGFYFQWQDQAQEFRLGSCYPGSGGQFAFLASELVLGSNHVVIQTKSGGFKIFLNGVLVEDLNLVYSPASNSVFKIGGNTVNGQNYIGGLDNFAVYDRVLTTDEILQHYAAGSDLLNR